MTDTPTTSDLADEPDEEIDFDSIPAVDDWAPALERTPDAIPDDEGTAYLEELQSRLEERADDPDVKAFIDGLHAGEEDEPDDVDPDTVDVDVEADVDVTITHETKEQ